MNIHIKPETSTLRVFLDDNQNYYNKDAYDTILTLHHIGDDEIFICGMHGKMNRKVLVTIFSELKSMGIKTVKFERHGNIKVHKL